MAVDFSDWDASKAWANGAASANPASFYDAICAGKKDGDPSTQAAHALPYRYTPDSGPNADGVRNALARLPLTDGLTNKAEASAKLEGLMKEVQAAEQAAKKSATVAELRAEYYGQRRLAFNPAMQERAGGLPGGNHRLKSFPDKQLRAELTERNGQPVYQVSGYATVYNRSYEMWDMFGPYNESVAETALDKSLAADPDVAWLVNHRGVTMARTTNGSLVLNNDLTGLGHTAQLNASRQDVRDIATAIIDGDIDEMSFAFMIVEGEWDEDYMNFRLTELDINRGDVSAVNYGANPYTSISARAAEWLTDAEHMPAVVRAEAMRRISLSVYRDSAVELGTRMTERYARAAEERSVVLADDGQPKPEPVTDPPVKTGKSLSYWTNDMKLEKLP